MITEPLTTNRALRLVAAGVCACFVVSALSGAGRALYGLVSYGTGQRVEATRALPLSFFDAARFAEIELTGGSSPMKVPVFSGTYQGEQISVLTRRPLDRAQEYHPAIRVAALDPQVATQTGMPAPVFDVVTSIPGYYLVKLMGSLLLAAVMSFLLLVCVDRHRPVLDFLRKDSEEKEA